jgi:hypothetical protein
VDLQANPRGTERLYTDGVFPTSMADAESFGNDLLTGTPISPDKYRELQPNGRAIIKHCRYAPPEEMNDREYPYMLSTGRIVHHVGRRKRPAPSVGVPHEFMFVSSSIREQRRGDLSDCTTQQQRDSSRFQRKTPPNLESNKGTQSLPNPAGAKSSFRRKLARLRRATFLFRFTTARSINRTRKAGPSRQLLPTN